MNVQVMVEGVHVPTPVQIHRAPTLARVELAMF